jgi:hypothetical protein
MDRIKHHHWQHSFRVQNSADQTRCAFFLPAVVPCILILSKVFYLPADAQENCFKKNIKIYIKAAPTFFSLIAIIRERNIGLAKVTVVKIIN